MAGRPIFAALFLLLLCAPGGEFAAQDGAYTRVVSIKQGSVRGRVMRPRGSDKLSPVEVFLGMPYAAAPIGSQRFMPPAAPPTWSDIKEANSFGPVCPQHPPDMSRGTTMPDGRYNYLHRLLPHLVNQSEDCLYLNIYAPAQDSERIKRHPVMVYIHGESYEWNSGNPYDGSVLASYGRVVVVTINFRLGILGFLRPSLGESTLSNFGILDQIAALQWVKENIGAFGGDPSSVTLMGHSTGAACVNFLLISPVSQAVDGLFHRAILMSGTALADWAITTKPLQVTIQVAEHLNCPLTDAHDELASCLRRKHLSEIMAVRVEVPAFTTPLGPVVDGRVIPNEPAKLMKDYRELFSRYELLYGLTQLESYPLMDPVALSVGLLESQRDTILRNYVTARFELRPDQAKAEALRFYSDWRQTPHAETTRDGLMDLLSDARVAAPLVRTANYHSTANPQSYFYVFTHRSRYGDHVEFKRDGSIHGEELPYVFGIPVSGSTTTHFHQAYTMAEKLFSEAVMSFWTNFAHSGTPNVPKRNVYLTNGPRDWRQYDVDWPEYNTVNQTYMSLGIPPRTAQRYRHNTVSFWNEKLPAVLRNPTATLSPNEPPYEVPVEVSPPWMPPPQLRPPTQRPIYKRPTMHPYENFNKPYVTTRTVTYGTVVRKEGDWRRPDAGDRAVETKMLPTSNPEESFEEEEGTPSTAALPLVYGIGGCLLLVNLCAFVGLYYQRDRLRVQEQRMKRQYEDAEVLGERPARQDVDKKERSGDDVYEAVRSAARTVEAGDRRWGLSRQCSTSTMDPHAKVREWIVQRCSPRFIRRALQPASDTSQEPATAPTTTQPASTATSKPTTNTLHRPRVKKVSVAVDATPAARSASVLKQTPIEQMSRSLDHLGSTAITPTTCVSTSSVTLSRKPSLKRSATAGDDLALRAAGLAANDSSLAPSSSLRRSTSINLQVYTPPLQFQTPEPVRVQHQHSASDPVTSMSRPGHAQPRLVDIPLDAKSPPAKPRTPKLAALKKDASVITCSEQNVNVTSRDSLDEWDKGQNTMPADTLRNIQKRNFPKVLPDLPGEQAPEAKDPLAKRRSLPPPAHLTIGLCPPLGEAASISQPTTPTQTSGGRVPPPPPPRVSSTLGRKPTNTAPVAALNIPATHAVSPRTMQQQQQRMEPRIIIKPTSTAPVTRKVTPRVTTAATETSRRLASTATNPVVGVPVPVPKVPTTTVVTTPTSTLKKRPLVANKSSDTSTDESSSNTGTVRRVKRAGEGESKAWYAQYSQSGRNKSKDGT